MFFRFRRRTYRLRMRRRRYARARLRFKRRRPHIRYRRRRVPRTFHVRLRQILTSDWPAAPKTPQESSGLSSSEDPETPLQWNFDHLSFKLSNLLTPGHGAGKFQHSPPFRYFKIKKIVVKGTWINWPAQNMENVLGHTALDLDGEDTGRGNATRSNLDPGKPPSTLAPAPDPDKAPFQYDPLMDRMSARAFKINRGFVRIFRPKPQFTQFVLPTTNQTHWLTKGVPWISVREGADLVWNGLSISLRQMKDPLNQDPQPPVPQVQYDISAYVQFKEFDYEAGRQL
ncbi:capsid protein [Banfec circovirus 2]|uniref:capsid protein n=1 Tax=Banfec circovirus 2 TaxID=3038664 RepID=UPI0040037E09|nr:capsid protein [Banfec circovirus 2]